MAAEDLVIRAQLRDELTAGLRGIEQQVERTARAARRLALQGAAAGGPRGLGALDRATAPLGRSLSGLNNLATRLSTTLGTHLAQAARRGGLALGLLGAAATGIGVKTAADFQMAEVSLRRLTGSAEAGADLFRFMTELDPMRPFDLGQLNQAAVTLASFGVKGEELKTMLAGVTDAVATNPAALDNTTRAIGQMTQAGQIFAQDLNQLIQAGIPGLNEAMLEAYGMTAAEVRRANEQGGATLAAKPFLDALFAGAEGTGKEIATKTFRGLLSGVKSRAMLNLVDAFNPLLGILQTQLPALELAFGGFVETMAPALSELVGKLVPLVGGFLTAVGPLLAAVFSGLGTLLDAAAPAFALMQPVIDELVVAIGELVTALVPVMPELVRGFVLLVGLLPDFVRLLTLLVPLVEPLVDLLDTMLGFGPTRVLLLGVLGALLGFRAVAGLVTGVWQFVAALKGLAGAMGLVNAANAAGGAGGAAGGAAATAGRGAGLLRYAGAAGAVGVGGMGAYATMGDAMKNGASAGNVLGSAASGALVGAGIGSILPGVGTLVGAGMGAVVGGGGALIAGWMGDKARDRQPQASRQTTRAQTVDYSTTLAPGSVVIDARGMSEAELARLVPREIDNYNRQRAERGAGASRGG